MKNTVVKSRHLLHLIILTGIISSCNNGDRTAQEEKLYTDISVTTFNIQFLNTGPDTLLLDVRTPEEFETGHIPGAVHLHVDDAEFRSGAAQLDSSKVIVVYCRTGVRSVTASQILTRDLGFKKVYNLHGGYTEWASTDSTGN